MRKKIFGGIAVLTIAVVAAWNVNLGSKGSGLSGISLANVEVLACENTITTKGSIITVAVCDRKTDWIGWVTGTLCNIVKDGNTCSFTNTKSN